MTTTTDFSWLAKVPVKGLCRQVRLFLREGMRIEAVRRVRQWLIATGRGDSFDRAKLLVQDVQENRRWTR